MAQCEADHKMAQCEADHKRMKTICKIVVYGILAVYTILLLQSPVTISTYSAVVNLTGILLSTLGIQMGTVFLNKQHISKQTNFFINNDID